MNARRAGIALAVGGVAGLAAFFSPPWLAALLAAGAALAVAFALAPSGRAADAPPVRELAPDGGLEDTTIIDRLSEGVLLLDAEDRVVAANDAAARILGRPRSGMIGVSPIRATRDHALLEVLREASGEATELTLGEQRSVLVTAAAVEGGPIRRVLTLHDLTPLRRAERARQELVANVSHELRTPIAAALALAETLEGGVPDEAQRARFHEQLTSEVERLAGIVDRLLRLSRIESGTEEFRLDPVAALDLLEEARRRIGPVAERRSVGIECAGVPGLLVRADRERILEVLANLLDNAIRFSPAGSTVQMRVEAAGGDMVRVSVADRGPGILPSDRLRVFERFYMGDRARRESGGTGLGLSIARHILSRHGGEIWIAGAESGPGATLCFTLPREAAAASDLGQGGEPPGGDAGAHRSAS